MLCLLLVRRLELDGQLADLRLSRFQLLLRVGVVVLFDFEEFLSCGRVRFLLAELSLQFLHDAIGLGDLALPFLAFAVKAGARRGEQLHRHRLE